MIYSSGGQGGKKKADSKMEVWLQGEGHVTLAHEAKIILQHARQHLLVGLIFIIL